MTPLATMIHASLSERGEYETPPARDSLASLCERDSTVADIPLERVLPSRSKA